MIQKFFVLSALIAISTLAQAQTKLALNWKAEPQFGGFYAGEVGGHYKKNDLQVQILEGGSGTPTIQMLIAGQVDYAVVSADEIVLSHARGATDVVAVFAVYQTNPQGIMTRAERGFKTLEDVFKNEGMLLWQSGLPYAQFLVKKYSPLKVKTAPYSGGIGPFQADSKISQQCFFTSEPLAAQAAGLQVKTFLVADSGYNPYTTVLAVKASTLKAKPEEVKKMVQAVRSGWSDYLQNPEKLNLHMNKINKAMDLKTFEASAKAQLPLIQTDETKKSGLGVMTLERWETLVTQLHDLKIIKKRVDPRALYFNGDEP